MNPEHHSARIHHTEASQRMAFEILQTMLQNAANPGKFSVLVAEQLRELTGARTAILLQCKHASETGDHRVIAVTPRRRRALIESDEIGQLAAMAHDLAEPTLLHPGQDEIGSILTGLASVQKESDLQIWIIIC